MTIPQKIVAGLNSKSAKIRALAEAGYLRTEIAEFLSIRYQHVRKVLVDAGFEGGLQNDRYRPKREVIRPEIKPWSMKQLVDAGFVLVGTCDGICDDQFKYSAEGPMEPGVYAFVVNDTVMYVGLTRRSLRSRLSNYVYGHQAQKTSARIKNLILEALADGSCVQVCAATPPGFEWNGLPIDGASGLETGLIKLIKPKWNQQGHK